MRNITHYTTSYVQRAYNTVTSPSPLEVQRSPWIPRPIDNTALAAYMKCPRLYYYSMVLSRRGRGTKPALSFGSTWHTILETHYKTQGDLDLIAKAAQESWVPHDNPDDQRQLARALSSYPEWLARYGASFEKEQDNWGWTVGWPEHPKSEVPCELWWPGLIHPYTGKIDRIYEKDLIYVEDHKTTSQLGPQYFRQFDPSNQMMGYAVLAQELTGLPIAGVRINAFGCLKTQSKFERQTIPYAQERLVEWKENLNWWLLKIENSYRTHAEMLAAGRPLVEIEQAAWGFNFDACAGKYGQCTYSDLDTYPVQLRPRILETDFEESKWNPLNPSDDE